MTDIKEQELIIALETYRKERSIAILQSDFVPGIKGHLEKAESIYDTVDALVIGYKELAIKYASMFTTLSKRVEVYETLIRPAMPDLIKAANAHYEKERASKPE